MLRLFLSKGLGVVSFAMILNLMVVVSIGANQMDTIAEIQALITSLEQQIKSIDEIIDDNDSDLNKLLTQYDESKDLERKASLQSLIDKLTGTLNRLQDLKLNLTKELANITNQLNQLKEHDIND
jgi:chromosome segregation ATPase